MNVFRSTLLTLGLPLAGLAVLASTAPDENSRHARHPTLVAGVSDAESSRSSTVERERIRAHLAGAERMMRSADIAHLSEAQRQNREHAIERLRAYREAGVFPHNHDFPGRRVPYFRDAHGTLCAMAYLIAESGDQALVERVAAARNNARVRELASDPELQAWLERNGLTVAEAARVQPSYEGEPGDATVVDSRMAKTLAVSSVALSAVAIGLQAVDATPGEGGRAWLGLGLGSLSMVTGGAVLGGDWDGSGAYGGFALAAGATTIVLSLWNLLGADEAPGRATDDGVVTPARVPAAPSVMVRDRGRIGLGFTIGTPF